jgi:O-antigen/teichoic acid export membrane protein
MAKNYFYNLLLTLANLLFPILSFPYASRVLGPDGIGKVQFVFSFTQYFVLVAAIGIPIYGMKEIAKYKDDIEGRSKVFSELLVTFLLSSLTLFLIYLAVIFNFHYFIAEKNMYIIASLMILLSFSSIDWLFIGMEDFKSIALRSVLFKAIGLVLLYIFVKERSNFNVYLYILMFSYLGNNIFSFFFIKDKIKPVFSKLNLRKHLVPLFMILSTTLASGMYTIMDTVLLGFLSNDKMVGLYTAADKLSNITLPFVTGMGVILMPKIAKDFADKNMPEVQQTLNQTFRFLMFFSIPIAFGLALLAPEFLALFSGREFLAATHSMQILSLLPVVIGMGHMFLFLVLVPAGKNKEMLYCVLAGMVIFLLLNLLLVPRLQAVGSSIANISSEIIVTLLYLYFINKYFSFTYQWGLLLKAILSALIFIPIIQLTRQMSLPLVYTLIFSISSCVIVYTSVQLLVDFVKAKLNKA